MPTTIYALTLILFLCSSNAFSWPIPDTGQISCFDNYSQIDCPEPGDDFYGQDSQYIINPPSYTKLDTTGKPLPDNATSWMMIQDNITGLIWEYQTDDNSIHDKNKTYVWNDAQAIFIKSLNENNFGGMNRWRLPSILELVSIKNLYYDSPVIDPIFNSTSSFYWSSVSASNTDGIWGVNFLNGIVNYSSEDLLKSVCAVHQEKTEISNPLIVNTNTIIDKRTGLMWQRETYPSALIWKNALAHCENLTLDNHSDWRLPNIKELLSIVDFSEFNPSIYSDFEASSAFYWSSTSHTNSFDKAWGVEFDFGSTNNKQKSLLHYVRAVRGGQQQLLHHIFIQSPKQGDLWHTGKVIPIIWDTNNIAGDVRILISDNGGKSYTPIVNKTANDGQYDWSAPFPLTSASNCFLKIQPITAPDKENSVGLFTIDGASVLIHGQLTDSDDLPITNTLFSINGKSIQTDNDGDYACELTLFQSGSYDLLYWINNYQAKLFENIPLNIDETTLLNVKIPTILSLEGYITNYYGEIISNVTVTAENQTRQTDANGYYQFDKLDAGTTIIYISHPDHYPLTQTLEIIPGKCVSLNAELMQKGLNLNFVTTYIPEAIVDNTYQTKIKANGTMPLTFSVITGSLPQGITIDSQTGTIYGSASIAGSYTFTVRIHDASNLYAEREFTIDAFDALTLTTILIDGITAKENYDFNVLAKGGLQPYTFTLISGSFPDGLVLSKSGNISGVPLSSGSTNITVQVTDSRGTIENMDYVIQVYNPLTLPAEKVVDGIVGQTLEMPLSVTGGNGTYVWYIDSGILPDGLSINNTTQTLTGTFNQACNTTIPIFVTDTEGRKASCNFTFRVASVLAFVSIDLPNALKNMQYSESIPVQGGIEPYTFTCKGLPPNLTYNSQTGIISGTSTLIGYNNIEIQVSDSSRPNSQTIIQTMGLRTTSDFVILTNRFLPKILYGEVMDAIYLTAGGGKAPYTWHCDILPEGIQLDPKNGILSGTPLIKGQKTLFIQVQDADNRISEKEFFWPIIQKLEIITQNLEHAYDNIFYNNTIDVIGGIPPYHFQLKSGVLPTGLFLHTYGLLFGKTTVSSMSQYITIAVMDSDTPPQKREKAYQIETEHTLSLNPSSIPETKVGHAYYSTIKAMLGQPPFDWKIASPPNGLTYTLNLDSVTIQGTAQEPGLFTWTVEITDSSIPVRAAIQTYSMVIYDELKMPNPWLKSANTHVYYSDTIQVSGGKPPFTWRIVDNALPQSLNLDPQTGEIYGTIKDSGISAVVFTAEVHDSYISPTTIRQILKFDVNNELDIVTGEIPETTQFHEFSTTLVGGGGHLPYQWQIREGKLPHCIFFNAFTGKLQGRPNTAGTFRLTIELIDDLGDSDRVVYDWNVKPVDIVGDINNDSHLDLTDLILSLQYISNIRNDTIYSFDINHNCSLELTDVLYLINKIFIDLEK
jgi:hypothetical protein